MVGSGSVLTLKTVPVFKLFNYMYFFLVTFRQRRQRPRVSTDLREEIKLLVTEWA